MFKSIHRLAAAYLYKQIVINFVINGTHGYDTRDTDGINVYLTKLKKKYLIYYFGIKSAMCNVFYMV